MQAVFSPGYAAVLTKVPRELGMSGSYRNTLTPIDNIFLFFVFVLFCCCCFCSVKGVLG